MQAFHYMFFGAMQQIESIHANGEMEEVKEQKKLEKKSYNAAGFASWSRLYIGHQDVKSIQ